jgi:hypothetical protein
MKRVEARRFSPRTKMARRSSSGTTEMKKRKQTCWLQERDEVEEGVLELLRLRELREEEDEATWAPSPRSVRRTTTRNDGAAAIFLRRNSVT